MFKKLVSPSFPNACSTKDENHVSRLTIGLIFIMHTALSYFSTWCYLIILLLYHTFCRRYLSKCLEKVADKNLQMLCKNSYC